MSSTSSVAQFSPLSSPELSPPLGPLDSSPPSSPSVQPISLNSPPASPGPPHPYAASTKVVKPLRLYEKREFYGLEDSYLSDGSYDTDVFGAVNVRKSRANHSRSTSGASNISTLTHVTRRHEIFAPVAPNSAFRSSSRDSRDDLDAIDLSDDELVPSSSPRARRKSRVGREQAIWDVAITEAIDTANGCIDLDHEGLIGGPGLSFIPPSIGDLASLVVLPTSDAPDAHLDSNIRPTSLPKARSRTFARATTFPVRAGSSFILFATAGQSSQLVQATSMVLEQTKNPGTAAAQLNEIELHLVQNSIAQLPVELFWLENLTVLSMRGNLLTSIPPQISRLINLRELNVAQNKLSYLPAELMDMKLDIFTVDRNPWMQPPSDDRSSPFTASTDLGLDTTEQPTEQSIRRTALHSDSPEHTHRIVTATQTHFCIPSLTETCMRIILAPHDPAPHIPSHSHSRPQTVLEATYALPLSSTDNWPAGVLDTLRACVPQAVAKPVLDPELQASPSKRARRSSMRSRVSSVQSDIFGSLAGGKLSSAQDTDDGGDATKEEPSTHPGIGVCPSPAHKDATHLRYRSGQAVFVEHAEERFSWECVIAGVQVSESEGIPVRWRGCLPGCLNFLGVPGAHARDTDETISAYDASPSTADMKGYSTRVMMVIPTDDGEDDPSVQAIDLGGGLSGGLEFD